LFADDPPSQPGSDYQHDMLTALDRLPSLQLCSVLLEDTHLGRLLGLLAAQAIDPSLQAVAGGDSKHFE
jgi:hypothetical protein